MIERHPWYASRLVACLTACFLMSTPLYADEVSEEQARQIAAQFLAKTGKQVAGTRDDRPSPAPVLAYSRKAKEGERVPLYIYNSGDEDGGFVIVSGDDGTVAPVLGYSDKGSFSYDKAPCGLKMLLAQYEQQIGHLAKHPKPGVKKWNKTRGFSIIEDVGNVVVGPLLKTQWSQDAPYYDMCPKVNGESHALTGCVATAIAQIMAYWKYPAQGRGKCSYTFYTTKTTTYSCSADLNQSTYDWDNMLDTYGEYTEVQGEAVARLMFDAGVALNMNYGYGYWGSSPRLDGDVALPKYFDYNPDSIKAMSRDFATPSPEDNNWDEILKKELDNLRPVEMSGNVAEGIMPHAFVVDGYTDKDYFHINFGWAGQDDGYYKTKAIDIYYHQEWDRGTQGAVYGICPAHSVKQDDSYYCLGDNQATIVFSLVEGSLEVPESIDANGASYPVTAIARNAFYENEDVTNVSLPASIERINDFTFRYCSNLQTVRLPASIKSIGRYAFADCPSLSEINLSSSLESIGEYAFYKCNSLREISMPAAVKSIEPFTFSECRSLTSVTAPGVEIVKKAGFGWCSSLEDFVGDCLTELGDSAFHFCNNLSHISLDHVKKIGSWAGLTEYAYLPVVEEIGEHGWLCNIANIGPHLNSWTVYSMYPDYITIDPDNPYLTCFDGIVYDKDMSVIYYSSPKTRKGGMAGDEYRRELIIPETVGRIERHAILSATNTALGTPLLEKVVIPASVWDIGNGIYYKEVYNYAMTPQPNEFDSPPFAPGTLHVPQGTKALYEAAEGWNQYEAIIDDLPLTDSDSYSPDDEDIALVNGVRFEMDFYHPLTGQPVNYEFLFQSQPVIKYEHSYNEDHTKVYDTEIVVSSDDIELLYGMKALKEPTYSNGIRRISFFYDDTVNGINDVTIDSGRVRFAIEGRQIHITGLQHGETVSLYHLDGRQLKSVKALADGTARMDISGSQGLVYVLKAGDTSFKLRIK